MHGRLYQNSGETTNLEITWLAHCCVRLRTNKVTILTDPYPDTKEARLGKIEPDIVTISNMDPNHSRMDGFENTRLTIDGPGEYAMSGVYIKGVMTSKGSDDPLEHRNTTYFMEIEGLKLCHLGDLKISLTNTIASQFSPIDVLFLPSGGSLESSDVSYIVQTLAPRIIIPIHYKVPGLTSDLNSLETITKELSSTPQEPLARVQYTATNLPATATLVPLKATGIRNRVS